MASRSRRWKAATKDGQKPSIYYSCGDDPPPVVGLSSQQEDASAQSDEEDLYFSARESLEDQPGEQGWQIMSLWFAS